MELLSNLLFGFQVVLSPSNMLLCLTGVALGTLVGVLPGIGTVSAIAVLLPLTFYLPPLASLIMLAGIYYGSQYGGSTAAILVNVPGEISSVVSCMDGHAMARQGRAGPALAIAALSSFFAGCLGTLGIAVLSGPLSAIALNFRSPEYFSLMVLGVVAVVVMAHGSILKAMAMVLVGLLLGFVGMDVTSGVVRFGFGSFELSNGISFVVIAVGLFGFGETAATLVQLQSRQQSMLFKIKGLMPTGADFRAAWKPMVRGSLTGCALGPLPGAGATLSAFVAYSLEKRIAADPSRFGRGAIEGLAAPESANNAAAQTSFIPLLILGIPGSAATAMMIGALTMQGISPGPLVITRDPDLFWGLVASMFIGNAMLLLLNLPMIGIWVRLLSLPYRLLYPAILLFSCIGVYSVRNSIFDVLLAAGFGVAGYFFSQTGCQPVPLLLALILGPMMEENLRRSLALSRGDFSIFVTQPVSFGLLLAAAALLVSAVAPAVRRRREEAFQGEE